jgi:hypothetical protein
MRPTAPERLNAGFEVARLPTGTPRDVVVERVVMVTVRMEQMLSVRPRLAQEHFFEAAVAWAA